MFQCTINPVITYSFSYIIFKADKGLRTLIDLRYNKLLKANHGEMGRGRHQTGLSAEDKIVIVPVGTTIKDTDTNLIICDLVEDGQECVVAKGGRGGKGNAAFMSNKNKAPLIITKTGTQNLEILS